MCCIDSKIRLRQFKSVCRNCNTLGGHTVSDEDARFWVHQV